MVLRGIEAQSNVECTLGVHLQADPDAFTIPRGDMVSSVNVAADRLEPSAHRACRAGFAQSVGLLMIERIQDQ